MDRRLSTQGTPGVQRSVIRERVSHFVDEQTPFGNDVRMVLRREVAGAGDSAERGAEIAG